MNHRQLLTNLQALPLRDRRTPFEEILKTIHPDLELMVSPRARRIALRLDTTTRTMRLVVPKRFSMKKAEAFAREHQNWIITKLNELPEPIPFIDGNLIPVLGQDRQIRITFNADRKTTAVTLHDDLIAVETNKEDPSARITRFLKREARDTMSNLAREKASRIDKTISALQIRDTKSRWGSCGPDARISLSWRLIFAPWEAMDYVVAHEVAHLVHLNHSKKFWSLCADLSDDYKNGKKWMRQNGNELMRYGS